MLPTETGKRRRRSNGPHSQQTAVTSGRSVGYTGRSPRREEDITSRRWKGASGRLLLQRSAQKLVAPLKSPLHSRRLKSPEADCTASLSITNSSLSSFAIVFLHPSLPLKLLQTLLSSLFIPCFPCLPIHLLYVVLFPLCPTHGMSLFD
ncbi:hypothetical protein FQN60_007471, partial [Etheostoma spectabile]